MREHALRAQLGQTTPTVQVQHMRLHPARIVACVTRGLASASALPGLKGQPASAECAPLL